MECPVEMVKLELKGMIELGIPVPCQPEDLSETQKAKILELRKERMKYHEIIDCL